MLLFLIKTITMIIIKHLYRAKIKLIGGTVPKQTMSCEIVSLHCNKRSPNLKHHLIPLI